jgi:rSAM/selenodomain-associated transferase 2
MGVPKIGVSVIVPLLNESAVAQSLIEHLRSLDAEQILIVDGGSQDNTVKLMQGAGFTVLSSQAGRAQQMNAGAKRASQARLLFLHADTRLPIEYKTELLKADVWGRFDVRFDSSLMAMSVVAFFMYWRSRISGVSTGDQALFIDAHVFHSIGGFPNMPIMEDVALCKRLRQLHAPYSSKYKVLTSARRWLQNGIVKTVLKMWWYRLAFFFGASPVALKKGYDDVR